MAVDGPCGGDEPVPVYRPGVRPDHELHAVRDVGVSGSADPGDPTVLDADVRLQHTDEGVDQHDAGDQHVELAFGGGPVELGHPRPEVLRVAPHRLVSESDVVILDPDP
jgi:hypothetical protein